jgi:adenylate cyclase
MDGPVAGETLAFERWRFHRRGRVLSRLSATGDCDPVVVGSRALEILALLLERPRTLVSKEAIMDAVWPGVAVEPNNITVQIAALRRVLDEGRTGESCIQTVPGRGYRFTASVEVLEEPTVPPPNVGIATAPRLSLVVLPFENLGGDPRDDYLADAVTEDLTTNLSRLPGALVIARTSAAVYKGKSVDVRNVGQQLGVRYAIEGSTRRLGDILRVSVQLVSTETGVHLWADRFDQDLRDLSISQDEIANRLSSELGVQVVEIESARSVRERPTNPDAFDFLLRGRYAFKNQSMQSIAFYEQALQLDPSSARVMILLARELINRYIHTDFPDRGKPDLIERASALISAAAAIEANSEHVVFAQGFLLRAQARHTEAIALLQHLIQRAPNNCNAFRQLGICKIAKGQASEAIPLLQRSIRLDPLSPNHRFSCHHIGRALALLGRDAESIEWQQRALAATVEASPAWRAACHLWMASAYANISQSREAKQAALEASRIWPHVTVRSFAPLGPFPATAPALFVQMCRIREGLGLTGLRDHAEEDADFGVPEAGEVCTDLIGWTPTSVPGATTIRTNELVDILAREKPVLIDVALHSWGRSIPGAIGLRGAGHGFGFSDDLQNRLSRKIQELTKGDLSVPIVSFCVNSERFTGYNLALRLAALGCTQVYWYRGGFEAWQVNGLPESDLELQDW